MTFNLISQPWVLVQRLDGRADAVSLRDLFVQAGDIRTITGELPTQVFAILRLALAVLHRAVDGPAGVGKWGELWGAGRLPVEEIDSYLEEYRDRFDLLHPQTPFYQVADLRTAKGEVFGLERLIADVPNGEPFLTSRSGSALASLSPAEAARWVVHCQAYDVSGIKSGAVGDSRVKGGKGYPIGTGFAGGLGGLFAEGDTLRETLLLNLMPEGIPYLHRDPDDVPTWEMEPLTAASADPLPKGLLGLYTWQSRRIRLFGDETAITGVLITNGDKLDPHNMHQQEPLSAWRRSQPQEKKLKIPTVYMPRTHIPGRALWRGLAALLPGTAGRSGMSQGPASLDPAVLEWLGEAVVHGFIDTGFHIRLRTVGVVYGTQQSIVDEVLDDSLAMNIRLLASEELAVVAQAAAADVETAVKALSHLAVNVARAAGMRDDKGIDGARDRASEIGYAQLDQHFRDWLSHLDGNADPAAARVHWQQTVRTVVTALGDRIVADVSPAAWAGRSVDGRFLSSSQADLWFRAELYKALPLAYIPDTEKEGAAA